MPTKVLCNVEDHRLFDNGIKVEDVTSVQLPTIAHPTTTVKSAGMVMDIDVPNMYHFDAMEFAINHNNGVNCHYLSSPGKHSIEFRIARMLYNVGLAETENELTKVRALVFRKSTEKGSIETENPYGSTEKYSIIRYEEEIDGEVRTLIDAAAGKIVINGRDYSSELASLLD